MLEDAERLDVRTDDRAWSIDAVGKEHGRLLIGHAAISRIGGCTAVAWIGRGRGNGGCARTGPERTGSGPRSGRRSARKRPPTAGAGRGGLTKTWSAECRWAGRTSDWRR